MFISTSKKRAASLLFFVPFSFFIAVISLISACSSKAPDKAFQLSGFTMGTSYHITVVEPSNAQKKPTLDKNALKSRINLRLALINQQMSTYIENSELSKFNRTAVDQWVDVSPELFDVLVLGLELGWLTNGALDISIGPIVDLWGFGPNKNKNSQNKSSQSKNLQESNQNVPSPQIIKQTMENVGFQHLEFDMFNSRVRKLRDISLDLSSIAKGYGVDKISQLLSSSGYTDFMVEIGGELKLSGHSPRGTPWRIAIEQPGDGYGNVHKAVTVSNVGLATSGDYRIFFESDGKRFSHLIDPKTGAPITHNVVSVTVIAETTAYADGLATAFNVMGVQAGLQLAEQQNIAVYFISKTNDGFTGAASEAFKPYLK